MKATIVYYSSRGRTAGYARDIAMYLWSMGLDVSLCSTSDCDMDKLQESDLVLLGCWTSGLFVFGQHPNKHWVAFAQKVPQPLKGRLLLFTTYKIRTGSMFAQMSKHLGLAGKSASLPRLASKSGRLSQQDKETLYHWVRS